MDTLKTVKGEFQSQVVQKATSQFTVTLVFKYLLEGIAIAIAAYVIPNKRTRFNEVAGISLFAALALFILDLFAGEISKGARFGAGFGIGFNLVNALRASLPIL